MLEWRSTAGRRTSNTLIPIVGDEAVNAKDHKTFCGEEEHAYMRSKTIRTKGETERERETKNMFIFIQMQQLQCQPTLQKVTKSLYMPFMLFT